LYYNIIILWDHRRICGPSLIETSLCGTYLYLLSTRFVFHHSQISSSWPKFSIHYEMCCWRFGSSGTLCPADS